MKVNETEYFSTSRKWTNGFKRSVENCEEGHAPHLVQMARQSLSLGSVHFGLFYGQHLMFWIHNRLPYVSISEY